MCRLNVKMKKVMYDDEAAKHLCAQADMCDVATVFIEDDRFLIDCTSVSYSVKCFILPLTFGPMTRFPVVPWTRPSAAPHPPAAGLNSAWTPSTGAPLPYAAAEQQASTGDHLQEKRNASVQRGLMKSKQEHKRLSNL